MDSASDALDVAGCSLFTGGPGVNTTQPDSVHYVRTSFGKARSVLPIAADAFTGGRDVPNTPDDAPVWVIVAYGDFPESGVKGTKRTPRLYTTVWAVIVEGTAIPAVNYSTDTYDLARLGDVRDRAGAPACPDLVPAETATPAPDVTVIPPADVSAPAPR